ncbi:MAG: SLBB domain-containing protein, partial [Rhodanobacteraceae bacterium]
CKCMLKDTAGNEQQIKIIRDGRSLGPFNADALAASGQAGPTLQPGDQLAFANKPVAVTVKGEIKSPGVAYLGTDEPLSQAIAQLGGVTANASNAQIILNRDGALTEISDGSPEFSQPAHAGDILTIPSVEHVQVIGAVATQGDVTLKNDFTLLSALYYAGGPNRWADLSKIMVRHRGVTQTYNMTHLEHGNLTENPALQDGDVVFVPEGYKIDWRGFFQTITLGRFLFPNGRL